MSVEMNGDIQGQSWVLFELSQVLFAVLAIVVARQGPSGKVHTGFCITGDLACIHLSPHQFHNIAFFLAYLWH